MSVSPSAEDAAVAKLVDDDAQAQEPEEHEPSVPAKRGRGRPKGSKNKKPGDVQPGTTVAPVGSSAPAPTSPTGEPRKKRGRPPKPKGEDQKPKRPRGRPPKNPKRANDEDEDEEEDEDPDAEAEPPKKKRGRPSSKAE